MSQDIFSNQFPFNPNDTLYAALDEKDKTTIKKAQYDDGDYKKIFNGCRINFEEITRLINQDIDLRPCFLAGYVRGIVDDDTLIFLFAMQAARAEFKEVIRFSDIFDDIVKKWIKPIINIKETDELPEDIKKLDNKSYFSVKLPKTYIAALLHNILVIYQDEIEISMMDESFDFQKALAKGVSEELHALYNDNDSTSKAFLNSILSLLATILNWSSEKEEIDYQEKNLFLILCFLKKGRRHAFDKLGIDDFFFPIQDEYGDWQIIFPSRSLLLACTRYDNAHDQFAKAQPMFGLIKEAKIAQGLFNQDKIYRPINLNFSGIIYPTKLHGSICSETPFSVLIHDYLFHLRCLDWLAGIKDFQYIIENLKFLRERSEVLTGRPSNRIAAMLSDFAILPPCKELLLKQNKMDMFNYLIKNFFNIPHRNQKKAWDEYALLLFLDMYVFNCDIYIDKIGEEIYNKMRYVYDFWAGCTDINLLPYKNKFTPNALLFHLLSKYIYKLSVIDFENDLSLDVLTNEIEELEKKGKITFKWNINDGVMIDVTFNDEEVISYRFREIPKSFDYRHERQYPQDGRSRKVLSDDEQFTLFAKRIHELAVSLEKNTSHSSELFKQKAPFSPKTTLRPLRLEC